MRKFKVLPPKKKKDKKQDHELFNSEQIEINEKIGTDDSINLA